jgi:hypothetical protein
MAKIIKNVWKYDLTKQWADHNGNIYAAADSLYAWYQFDTDVSSGTDTDLPDKSGNSRDLVPGDQGNGDRPYAPTSDAPFAGGNVPAGFPTKSARFSNDVLEFEDSGAQFSFGDGTTDSPFSVSCWFKSRIALAGGTDYQTICGKYNTAVNPGEEWVVYLHGDVIYLNLRDDSASAYVYQRTYSALNPLQSDTWYHITVTYDGRGGSTAYNGIKIYINGESVDSEAGSNNTYVAMENTATDFTVGNKDNESSSFDLNGELAELTVWSSQLSAANIKAMYSAFAGVYSVGSGFLNNPPRILLQDQDNRPGSYPTVARTGDPDFMGRSRSYFDDRTAVDFFSSYATAEIRFDALPRWAWRAYPPDSISLTGTLYASSSRVPGGALDPDALPYGGYPTNKAVFEFVAPLAPMTIRMTPGAEAGDRPTGNVKSFPVLIDPGTDLVGLEDADDAGKLKARLRGCARRLAAAVNFSSIGIKAYAEDRTVFLRQQVPTLGTYALGNLVQTSSESGAPDPLGVTISQFAQHGPSEYLFPMVLPADSTHILDNVAAPNVTGTLSSKAIMSPGVSDLGLKFEYPGEDLSPFDGGRILIDPNSDFFKVGTPESLLPGFSARLADKTSFAVNITPSETTKVYFATGTDSLAGTYANSALGLAGGINSGLAYFNFIDQKWEIIGDLTTGSNVDYLNGHGYTATGSYLAVLPPKCQAFGFAPAGGGSDYIAGEMGAKAMSIAGWNTGLPCEFAGFPVSSKFDATGSQLLDMSNYLSSPLLLEKVVLEISGAFGTVPSQQAFASDQSSYYDWNLVDPTANPLTFMLLNQFQTELSGGVVYRSSTGFIDYGAHGAGGTGKALVTSGTAFPANKNKDIIWYGRYASYESGNTEPDGTYGPGTVYLGTGWASESILKNAAPAFHKAADVWKPVTLGSAYTTISSEAVYTGSITIKAPPRVTPLIPDASYPAATRGLGASPLDSYRSRISVPLMGNNVGGRNLFDLSSGRSYIGSTAGGRIVGTVSPRIQHPVEGDDYPLPVYEATERVSPYVLMPGDKLILAVANQRYPLPQNNDASYARPYRWEPPRRYQQYAGSPITSTDNNSESPLGASSITTPDLWSMTFPKGAKAKITFYGTELRSNQPVSFTLNQPLTSDAIHEDVRDDMSPYGEAKCLDQFDTDPVTSFRGGYLDNIITGSMVSGDQHEPSSLNNILTNFVDQYAANVRAVQASVVDGGAGVTGSLQRFVRVTDTSEVYYDSTVPKFADVMKIFGMSTFSFANANWINLQARDSGGTSLKQIMGYPFEPALRYLEGSTLLQREASATDPFTDTAGVKTSQGILSYTVVTEFGQMWGPVYKEKVKEYAEAFDISKCITDPTLLLKLIWGVGGGDPSHQTYAAHRGVPITNAGVVTIPDGGGTTYAWMPALRGFKYGLINAVPTSPNAVFRYDTYGQFRDMLEQRPYTKFFVDSHVEQSAVEIEFRERLFVNGELTGGGLVPPADTNSQNLSSFATSSVPYFDIGQNAQSSLYPWGRDRATPPPDIAGIDTYSYDTG